MLPARQDKALVALASDVLCADLTGVGRHRWPAYFAGPPPRARHTNVRIQAGIARPAAGGDAVIDTTLLWAGRTPAGQKVSRELATVRLAWNGTSWQPSHSQKTP